MLLEELVISVDSVSQVFRRNKLKVSQIKQLKKGRGEIERELKFMCKPSVIGSFAGARAAWSSWDRLAFCRVPH